jgi:Protein of unknown function (DUF3486)
MSLMAEHGIKVKTRTAHRLSKVEQLPIEAKNLLDEMLSSRRYSQVAVLDAINSQLKMMGFNENSFLTRSSLNRYFTDFVRSEYKRNIENDSFLRDMKNDISELKELLKLVLERLSA